MAVFVNVEASGLRIGEMVLEIGSGRLSRHVGRLKTFLIRKDQRPDNGNVRQFHSIRR